MSINHKNHIIKYLNIKFTPKKQYDKICFFSYSTASIAIKIKCLIIKVSFKFRANMYKTNFQQLSDYSTVYIKLTLLLTVVLVNYSVYAADCFQRGDLDNGFCDKDNDLLADLPVESAKWQNPKILKFAYTPVEDHNIYRETFGHFMEYLEKATGKKVKYYPTPSNSSEVEAMKIRRLHIAAFDTGTTGYAVNLAGFKPMSVIGYPTGFQGYNLIVITRKNSSIQKMTDLKNQKIAHTSTFSNSGNLAARAFFPALGIVPDKDYNIIFSDSHGQSILGILDGKYDAAPIASDVFKRMIRRGVIKREQFRVIYKSPKFPTSAFGYAHDLHPALIQKIVGAFHTYRFPPEMRRTFGGADRFYPVTYFADWKIIRNIAQATNTKYSKKGFEALTKFETKQE
jgi:phosphonate transport system substrate-binding protein